MTVKSDLYTHEVFNQSPVFQDINLFTTDPVLKNIVQQEENEDLVAELTAFGEVAGSAHVLELGQQANENQPKLKLFDQKGNRLDKVEFHPAYHELMAISMKQGLHCSPWEHLKDGSGTPVTGSHVKRSAGLYMIGQADSGHGCPVSMTHAAVATLVKQDNLSAEWLPKILSRDYDKSFRPVSAKTSATLGMGMTEKQGGSDVRANTTKASPARNGGPGEEYILTGHKWFMSAPMCDAFLVLAQAPAGLSCFLVPRFLPDGSVNGLQFQRLKEKLGNKSNASSEVEFHNAHGWLIGDEGRGVANIIDMVTFTRLDCAVMSSGLMRLAFANALHHAENRTVFQKRLVDQPLMGQVLADMALDVEAATRLSFRMAQAFDKQNKAYERAIARLMMPVAKFWICQMAPALVFEAMVALGGNGYVEEGILSRIYREVPVNAIWEGSGNVMCLDVLRVVQRDRDAVDSVVAMLDSEALGNSVLVSAVEEIKGYLSSPGELERNARGFVELLAMTVSGILLQKESSNLVADSYIGSRLNGGMRYTYGAGLRGIDGAAILRGYRKG
ncbi:MAG: acyl-CoA dehydrogenase family protein [Methyloligellaceae bacterium]